MSGEWTLANTLQVGIADLMFEMVCHLFVSTVCLEIWRAPPWRMTGHGGAKTPLTCLRTLRLELRNGTWNPKLTRAEFSAVLKKLSYDP